jgi:hypothetical protein
MVMTASVAALPEMAKSAALVKVAEFNDFTPENDPHGEHDFFSFEHCNRTFFWKCDYYNKRRHIDACRGLLIPCPAISRGFFFA